jgi:energy-coupling factor transporter transmembrane protein EcfT
VATPPPGPSSAGQGLTRELYSSTCAIQTADCLIVALHVEDGASVVAVASLSLRLLLVSVFAIILSVLVLTMPAPASAGAYGGQGPLEMGVTWTFTLLATAAVAARTYVTFSLLERPGWDFYWALLAWVSNWKLAASREVGDADLGRVQVTSLGCQAMQTAAAMYGIGNHMHLLTKSDIVQALKWDWLGRMIGVWASFFGKLVVSHCCEANELAMAMSDRNCAGNRSHVAHPRTDTSSQDIVLTLRVDQQFRPDDRARHHPVSAMPTDLAVVE